MILLRPVEPDDADELAELVTDLGYPVSGAELWSRIENCVSPQRRRQGIGTSLIQETEKHYRAQGVTDIRLHSGIQRAEAHEFYEKMGFDKSGYRFKKKL